MISASIYGKGCCCDCDADTWEDVLHQAVAHMMEQTNRAAILATMSPADLSSFIRDTECRFRLHDVKRAGWAPLSCGRGDGLRSHFTAKTPQGKVVRGTVCCGRIFKDCTVRYE